MTADTFTCRACGQPIRPDAVHIAVCGVGAVVCPGCAYTGRGHAAVFPACPRSLGHRLLDHLQARVCRSAAEARYELDEAGR